MKKSLWLVLLSLSSFSFADDISITCGTNAGDASKAQYAFSAEPVKPESTQEWSLYASGKKVTRAESLVVKEKGYFVHTYIITEKAPANGHAYRQYLFNDVEKCLDGGPATLQVYQVGGGHGRVKFGDKLNCECDVD
jgi:hypothetical protein